MPRLTTEPLTRSRPERYLGAETAAAGVSPRTLVPDEVIIGGVRIAPATILAPMAGVTDTVFRRFIKHSSFDPASNGEMGERTASAGTRELDARAQQAKRSEAVAEPSNKSSCGLIMTEFTSADGIYRTRESKRKRYLHFYEDEHPISAQLFGSNPETLAAAAKIVEGLGFDLVDLNLGCPAKNVVKCNGGSGLLRDLPRIHTIFETVRAAVKIPFTVKFRMGWDDNEIVCVELAKLAERCGLNAVALHARTRQQGYSGNARWEWIAAIKQAVRIPVIGNGDIRTPEDAALMVEKTGCDAVMIGRTAPANPWIFRQISQYNASIKNHGGADASSAQKPLYERPSEHDRYVMMRRYFEMLINEPVPGAAGKMKMFASWFTHGVPGGGVLRKAVYESKTEQAVLDAVDRFFAEREKHPCGTAALGCAESDDALESMPFAECG